MEEWKKTSRPRTTTVGVGAAEAQIFPGLFRNQSVVLVSGEENWKGDSLAIVGGLLSDHSGATRVR